MNLRPQSIMDGIVGPVAQGALGQLMVGRLFGYLEQGACAPIDAGWFRRADLHTVSHFNTVAFFAQFLVCAQCQYKVTGSSLILDDFGLAGKHRFIVFGKEPGYTQQFRMSGGANDSCFCGGDKSAFSPFPLL